MTFWAWLDRRWPAERQWVTIALVATLWIMLQMAVNNPGLWEVKLFEIILQGVVLTGLLNMVLAFHFAANQDDSKRVENTGAAFRAIEATAMRSNSDDGADRAAIAVADAAGEKANEITGRAG